MGVSPGLSRERAAPRPRDGARVLCHRCHRCHRSRGRRLTMLQIDRLTWREIRLALKEPFRISSGVMHERRIGLLELTDRGGATAWSECVAFDRPMYSAETI